MKNFFSNFKSFLNAKSCYTLAKSNTQIKKDFTNDDRILSAVTVMTIFEDYEKCKSKEKEVIEVEDDEDGTLQDLRNETQAVATAINAEANSTSNTNNKPGNEDETSIITNSSKPQKDVADTKKHQKFTELLLFVSTLIYKLLKK